MFSRIRRGGVRRAFLVAFASVVVIFAAAGDSVGQPVCTVTWDGGSTGSWHEATNWTNDTLPGPSDNVCIGPGVTVEVSQDAGSVLTVQSQGTLAISGGSLSLSDTTEDSTTSNLTQSGGTLGGAGTLTVAGSFEWSGGTQTDAGTTAIASGATLSIDTATGYVYLTNGRTLQIDSGATATWTGQFGIGLGDAATIENAGTFNANGGEGGNGIFNAGGGGQLVHNAAGATFRKTAGSGTLPIGVPFDNDGTVQASAGTLSLDGGDADTTSGGFNGSGAGGLVRFQSSFTLQSGASLSGRIALPSGSLTVNAAVPITAGATFTQSGGTLGGAGTLTVAGSFEWSGGTQTDAGTTAIASGATLSIDTATGYVYLTNGRTLQIDSGATATWTGQFGIGLGDAATIENAGTFNANGGEGGNGIFNAGGGGQLVHNAAGATFRKTAGSGTLPIGVPFDNDGTVQASAGTLSLDGGDGGGEAAGSFAAATGTTLELGGGTFTLGSGSSLSGAGTVRVSGGTVATSGSYGLTGTLEVSGGTLTATSSDTVSNLTQSGGTLGGAGTLTVAGSFEWSGGTQTDAGTTAIASGATLSIDTATGYVYLTNGRTLQIDSGATATWTGQFGIGLGDAATIENAGTFNANGGEGGNGIFNAGGGGQLVHNAAGATFRKTAGSGTLPIGVPFDNDGTVQASAGTLSLDGGDADTTSGGFNGSGAGGLVRFQSSFTLQSGASLSGRIALPSGSLTVNAAVPITAGATFTQSGGTLGGAGTLTVAGSFEWSGGTQTDAGTTAIASGATLSIDTATGYVYLTNGRTLQIDSGATATWTGQFGIGLGDAATIENAGTFNANGGEGGNGIFNAGGGGQLVHNAAGATFRKTAGSGTLPIGVPFDNDGTVEIATGILGPTSYTQSATGTLEVHLAGTTPGTGFGQLDVDGTATLDGTLSIVTESGFTPLDGASFQIVNAGTRTGQFSTVEGTNIGGGLSYSAGYNPADVTLTVGTARQISIDDVSVNEGDAGQTDATFTVSLSSPAPDDVTVDFATADGSATAPGDYTAQSDTLTIPAGETSGQITVAVQGDTDDEPDENFLVNLSNASANATIADGQGVGTILDDDEVAAVPTLSINDDSVTEGDAGQTDATFTVSLSSPAPDDVTVDFATADGSATAPGDYTAQSDTLTIPAGETSGQITVAVQGDTDDEPDENFLVNLSNASANATIADGQGVGTILDDDEVAAVPTLSINDVSVNEGDAGQTDATFTVSLSSPAPDDVTVDFATADGSATAPGDYTAQSDTLTIPAGETSGQITVAVQGDTDDEPDENFLVNLSNASANATIADGQGVGTILDDDEGPPPPEDGVGAASARGTDPDASLGTDNATTTAQYSAITNCDEAQSTRPFIVRWTDGGTHTFKKTGAADTSTCVREGDTSVNEGTATGLMDGSTPATVEWSFVDGSQVPGPDNVNITVTPQAGDLLDIAGEPQPLNGTPGGVWVFPDLPWPARAAPSLERSPMQANASAFSERPNPSNSNASNRCDRAKQRVKKAKSTLRKANGGEQKARARERLRKARAKKKASCG